MSSQGSYCTSAYCITRGKLFIVEPFKNFFPVKCTEQPTNADTFNFIALFTDSVSPSLLSNEQIRIAGYHLQDNTWVFDDNEAMTYSNWNTEGDQPDGQTGIALSVSAGYKWHDVSDDRDLKFICEIRA